MVFFHVIEKPNGVNDNQIKIFASGDLALIIGQTAIGLHKLFASIAEAARVPATEITKVIATLSTITNDKEFDATMRASIENLRMLQDTGTPEV